MNHSKDKDLGIELARIISGNILNFFTRKLKKYDLSTKDMIGISCSALVVNLGNIINNVDKNDSEAAVAVSIVIKTSIEEMIDQILNKEVISS